MKSPVRGDKSATATLTEAQVMAIVLALKALVEAARVPGKGMRSTLSWARSLSRADKEATVQVAREALEIILPGDTESKRLARANALMRFTLAPPPLESAQADLKRAQELFAGGPPRPRTQDIKRVRKAKSRPK